MKKDIKKPVREKFDTESFVFPTDLTKIEMCLKNGMEELEDLLEYKAPDTEQRKRIEELTYWLGVWESYLPKLKEAGVDKVMTCAVENRVLGIYDGKKKGSRRRNK